MWHLTVQQKALQRPKRALTGEELINAEFDPLLFLLL